jgi:hypothetical protein
VAWDAGERMSGSRRGSPIASMAATEDYSHVDFTVPRFAGFMAAICRIALPEDGANRAILLREVSPSGCHRSGTALGTGYLGTGWIYETIHRTDFAWLG